MELRDQISRKYIKSLLEGRGPYGEIWVKDNVNTTTLNSSGGVQITNFDNNGESSNTLPNHTLNNITIEVSGRYFIMISLSVINSAPQSHIVDVSAFKNNGAIELLNTHSHRSLAGGSTDIAAMPLSGIANLVVGDTIELWATTNSAVDRNVTFEDCTLTLIRIGD